MTIHAKQVKLSLPMLADSANLQRMLEAATIIRNSLVFSEWPLGVVQHLFLQGASVHGMPLVRLYVSNLLVSTGELVLALQALHGSNIHLRFPSSSLGAANYWIFVACDLRAFKNGPVQAILARVIGEDADPGLGFTVPTDRIVKIRNSLNVE